MRVLAAVALVASLAGTVASASAQCSPQRLVNPNPVAIQRMGDTAAATGNYCAAGSPWGDVAGVGQAGFVRMYERGLFGWGFVTELSAPDGGLGDHFGHSISMSG